MAMAVELAGLGAIIYGVLLIWLPASYIVGGILAVLLAQGLAAEPPPDGSEE